MNKIEFLKPVFHIDTYFKIADTLLRSNEYELVEVGRAMRKVYESKMIEMEVEDEVDKEMLAFQKNEAELEAEQAEIPVFEGTRKAMDELMSDRPEDRMKQFQNPAECKTGVCD